MRSTIIIDLDGVVFDTITQITNLYNYDHVMYKEFTPVHAEDVKTWEFKELFLETPDVIDKYFNTPRFFENLPLMKSAEWIISKLAEEYKIVFCSSGSYPNLQLKRRWLSKHYPSADFIPVELPTYKDKSGVDMSNAIFVDDCAHNLETSNAEHKICFGEVYDWNKDWNGIRCKDWEAVYQYVKELENDE